MGAGQGSVTPLWVLDALYRNGAVRLTLQMAQRLGERSGRLVSLQSLAADHEVSVPPGVEVTRLMPLGRRLRRGLVPAAVRLAGLARRADVVVACSEIGTGLLTSAAVARLTRTPLVVAVHADLDSALQEWVPARLHPLFHRVHRGVAGAICVSADLVAPLVELGVPADRIRVVRNGIDVAGAQEAAGPVVPPAEGSLPVAVATGRVAHQKGYDLLVRAHARVVVEVPHLLRICNDGPDLEAIRLLVEELGVGDSVEFVDGSRPVLPVVAQSSVFCLPSRHEGLPLALLEAVALGVPCIAANCSEGVDAALDGGRVGDLVEVEDVDGLAAALRAHLSDPGPLRAKATLGPAHARTFDLDVMCRGWVAALEDFAGR